MKVAATAKQRRQGEHEPIHQSQRKRVHPMSINTESAIANTSSCKTSKTASTFFPFHLHRAFCLQKKASLTAPLIRSSFLMYGFER